MTTAPTQIAPVVSVAGNKPITTSRDIAKAFEKQHKHVLEKIYALECSECFLTANFSAVKFHHRGNQYTEYQITRDGFTFLAMGFTGSRAAQFKEAYIAEFNRLEAELRKPLRVMDTSPMLRQLVAQDQVNFESILAILLASFDDGQRAGNASDLVKAWLGVNLFKELSNKQLIEAVYYLSGVIALGSTTQ